jgi:hypothetical protein
MSLSGIALLAAGAVLFVVVLRRLLHTRTDRSRGDGNGAGDGGGGWDADGGSDCGGGDGGGCD